MAETPMASDRKFHPALKTGMAIQEQIKQGAFLPTNLSTPVTETVPEPAPVPAPAPAPAVPAVTAASAEDGLPPATYVDPATIPAFPPPPVPTPAAALPQESYISATELALQRQLAEERTAREALLAKLTETEEANRRAALAQEIAFEENELGVSDPKDAQVIARKTAEIVDKRMAAALAEQERRLRADLAKELQERQAQMAARTAQETEAQRWRHINGVLLSAVPELPELVKTPTYINYVSQRMEDGATRLTRIQEAFAEGNTDYIIKVMNRVKQAIPNFADITRVMPPASGTAAPKPEEKPKDSVDELSSHLRKAITGSRNDIQKFREWHAKKDQPATAANA